MIKFNLPVMPVAQGRPRFTRRGIAYTPAKTRKAKEEIRALVKAAYKGEPLTCALNVELVFNFPKSKNLIKRYGHTYHTKKPDLDNLTKLVLDALNGVLWVDDAQIYAVKAIKRYTPFNASVEIEVQSS
jgi:Holliday junction resolvase RusA-like endonuclease